MLRIAECDYRSMIESKAVTGMRSACWSPMFLRCCGAMQRPRDCTKRVMNGIAALIFLALGNRGPLGIDIGL
jgi:hypothetical protein